ncbi:MAG: hypothetical protein M1505_00335 [Patescibacteria group bacterium]|nr:hypothetical protein [Patescibacteria group bacterium]
MKKFIGSVFKLKLNDVVILFLLFALVLSNLILTIQVFENLNEIKFIQANLNQVKKNNQILEFDRIRVEDAANILLAIQDYYYSNQAFPNNLEELKKQGYLDSKAELSDPQTHKYYFYKNRGNDFVFCVWLSDKVKGVNVSACH